jgi:hypothetical protein
MKLLITCLDSLHWLKFNYIRSILNFITVSPAFITVKFDLTVTWWRFNEYFYSILLQFSSSAGDNRMVLMFTFTTVACLFCARTIFHTLWRVHVPKTVCCTTTTRFKHVIGRTTWTRRRSLIAANERRQQWSHDLDSHETRCIFIDM